MTPDSERRNSTAMYNPMMVSDLKGSFSWFDWDMYFSTLFSDKNITIGDNERLIVVQPDYFEATGSLNTDRETIGTNFTRPTIKPTTSF